ncbi:cytochrome c biogenesis protein CcdA [Pontimicrobium sp. SW4]|uniref:Cytochrome c biogenesis protein CcdA n=1 Tax=Pontimicrobium sp. SW4 TaxID=3153519 RepID=A0AAU7BT25_9FLAO
MNLFKTIMMRHIIVIIAFLFSTLLPAQILEPVKWEFQTEKLSEDEYQLKFIAFVDDNWAIYSQDIPDDGPIPTSFEFDKSDLFTLIGNVKENDKNKVTKHDPVFNMILSKFYNKAEFTQVVKLSNPNATITGTLNFMTCDDKRCLPPTDVPFEFNISDSLLEQEDIPEFNLGSSQILDPVSWEFETKKVSEEEYDIIFKANIDDKWAVYSQFVEEGGPLPTTFNFEESNDYQLIDSVVESDENKVTKHDKVFDMEVSKFYNQATFTQRIKVVGNQFVINGNVEYMTCDDEQCIFKPDNPFTFNYSKNTGLVAVNDDENLVVNPTIVNTENTNQLLYGMSAGDISKSDINCDIEGATITSNVEEKGKSLWSIFGLGFLGGLLALLTPCVFPMIPLTVSFFTKKSGGNNSAGVSKALLYGFFIFAVYVVLSVPFHLLDSVNPDILNEISTNVVLNVIFFIIFVFFAFSFFGYYELTLPARWTNTTTQGENIGGVLGIFFMALTLAIVSFSCTGPILGSLLAGSLTADGGAWQLTAGMAGFGVSLGLPFALFAMFPNMLNALPKSGGWLNTTKVVLGFLELALAFKFLSNADLVQHWGVLKFEAFLGLWIIIFAGLALYIFGKIRFPHDSPIRKLSFFRISSGILVAAFVVYLVSGFRVNKETDTFTSLTLLSGLTPPVGYSFIKPMDCPNKLDCFKDLKTGIEYAKKVNKPIILDFTGYACVNCRKMEEHVWPLPSIDKYLRNDYVLISLYVDDKKELPESERIEVPRINGGTRTLKNYGHKWAHFQTQFFQTNSQPYYVLLNPDGTKILNQPVGYTPNEEEYAKFLECGLSVFKESNKTDFSITP